MAHTYGYVLDIKRYNYISLWAKHSYQERKKKLVSIEYLRNIQIQYPVYNSLAYNEDPHLHCLEPSQHSWVAETQSPSSSGIQSDSHTTTLHLGN